MKNREAMRVFIAEEVARRVLAGQSTAALCPALRRLTTMQLLHDTTRPRVVLPQPLFCVLGTALRQSVRRRAGWLDFAVQGTPPAVALSPRLAAAALFSFVRAALTASHAKVCIRLAATASGVRLVLQSSHPAPRGSFARDAAALFALAAEKGGGAALHAEAPSLCQCLWLPALPSNAGSLAPECTPDYPCPDGAAGFSTALYPTVQELLADRHSLLHLYLAGFCAEDFDL